MRRLLLTCCAWLPWAAAVAQTPTSTCRTCVAKGCFDCSKHGKQLRLEQAPEVVCCSVAAACKVCAGALATDCRECSNPELEARLAERRQLAATFVAHRQQDAGEPATKKPFLFLQTTHLDLTCGLEAATVGRDKIDGHQRMHLYGQRMEQLRTVFLQTLELPESDLPDRLSIYLFDDARDHGSIGPRVTGLGNAGSVSLKLMGPTYVYSMWQDRRSLPDDAAVHRNVLHGVTHLLLAQMPPSVWLGNRKSGWLDEGLAHWFEDKLGGKCTNFCFEEILLQQVASFKGGIWRPAVRRLVDDGKAPTFAVLSALNSDELSYEQHAFAFAYVDFFLAQGGGKFRDFLRAVKKGEATRDALQAGYGLTTLTIDARFQQWVKDNYTLLPPR
ncbi:MAG: hypothetical protein K8J09_16385 [Planctomycetes bacterium]|nr:hypothetical protein [Planctomycetota bacterium]MCC7397183.1 hypothetical protein [Planctomycetota bacterium]